MEIAVRAAEPIGDGFYSVDVKQTDHGLVRMENLRSEARGSS